MSPICEKERRYDRLLGELRDLLGDERDLTANAANMASLLYHSLPDLFLECTHTE